MPRSARTASLATPSVHHPSPLTSVLEGLSRCVQMRPSEVTLFAPTSAHSMYIQNSGSSHTHPHLSSVLIYIVHTVLLSLFLSIPVSISSHLCTPAQVSTDPHLLVHTHLLTLASSFHAGHTCYTVGVYRFLSIPSMGVTPVWLRRSPHSLPVLTPADLLPSDPAGAASAPCG